MRIGGLASGLDIDNIVKNLMQAERIPLDKLFQKKVLAEWRRDEYRNVNTKLLSLRDSAFNMRLQSTFTTRKATTSNSSVVTAATTGNSQIGTFEIKVNELAKTAKMTTLDGKLLSANQDDKIDPTETLASQKDKLRDFSATESFAFKLNGEEFTVDLTKDSLNDVLDKINSDTTLGINAFYDQHTDKVVLTTKSTGESAEITIENDGSAGFLLNTLGLGTATVAGVTTAEETQAKDAVQAAVTVTVDTALADGDTFSFDGVTLTVGTDVDFVAATQGAEASASVTAGFLANTTLASKWDITDNGDGTVTIMAKVGEAADGDAGNVGGTVSFGGAATGSYVQDETGADAVSQVNSITLTDGAITEGLKITIGDRTYAVWDSGAGTYADAEAAKTALGADIVFDRNDLNFDGADEIRDAIIGDTANITDATVSSGGAGKLIITADTSGLNGAQAVDYHVGHTDNDVSAAGTNASLEINGLATERESNTFEINGTNFTIHSVQEVGDSPIRIDITQDVEKAFDNIMDFVNKYNELIDKLNDKYREPRYRDFLPLTEEQKDDMSDREIEKWEEKASSGMLKGDQMLNSVLSDMRQALMSPVSGLDGEIKNLFQIGITTGSWNENGKLHVNETKLKEALSENPEEVMALFTNSPDDDDPDKDNKIGLARRLYNSINSGMERITTRAGKSTSLYDQSFLSNEIRRHEQRMGVMEDRLIRVEDRYWRQFTAMEKALNEMYSQSDWLSQQLGALNG